MATPILIMHQPSLGGFSNVFNSGSSFSGPGASFCHFQVRPCTVPRIIPQSYGDDLLIKALLTRQVQALFLERMLINLVATAILVEALNQANHYQGKFASEDRENGYSTDGQNSSKATGERPATPPPSFDEEPFEFKAEQAGFKHEDHGFEDTTYENFESAGFSQTQLPDYKNRNKVQEAFEALELKGCNIDNMTERQVKKGYHKMALRKHPDKNPTPDAEEQFNLLTRQKELLQKYIKYRH